MKYYLNILKNKYKRNFYALNDFKRKIFTYNNKYLYDKKIICENQKCRCEKLELNTLDDYQYAMNNSSKWINIDPIIQINLRYKDKNGKYKLYKSYRVVHGHKTEITVIAKNSLI